MIDAAPCRVDFLEAGSSGPVVSAIEPVWSTRIGNVMPRPMNPGSGLMPRTRSSDGSIN